LFAKCQGRLNRKLREVQTSAVIITDEQRSGVPGAFNQRNVDKSAQDTPLKNSRKIQASEYSSTEAKTPELPADEYKLFTSDDIVNTE